MNKTTILEFMRRLLKENKYEAILLPYKVPAGDSYSWILCKDAALLEGAMANAPIMPVQGAKALKSLTRKGKGQMKVAAVMKPCEIRAAIELSKLNQVNLNNLLLITYDCAGAIPYPEFLKNSEKGENDYNDILTNKDYNSDKVKTVCQMCTDFSGTASDLHFAVLDDEKLIARSEKGHQLLNEMGIKEPDNLTVWEDSVAKIREKREAKKKSIFEITRPLIDGFDNLQDIFGNCIGCHNCQNACPICYCRQCYFDSEVAATAKTITRPDSKSGPISFPGDKIMFHVGRMAHMSLSCVSCGQCTDVCPVNIPVAKIFSYVAASTQNAFEYKAGNNEGEPLPLREFKLDEIANIDELLKETSHE